MEIIPIKTTIEAAAILSNIAKIQCATNAIEGLYPEPWNITDVKERILRTLKKLEFDLRECVEYTNIPMRHIDDYLEESDCEHAWVSMENEVIEGGEMCVKCSKIRATA